MAQWTTSSRASRPVAAAIAMALTAGFLALLQLRPKAPARVAAPQRGALVLLKPAPAMPSTRSDPDTAPRSRQRLEPQYPRHAANREPTRETIQTGLSPPAADHSPAPEVAAAAEPAPTAASAPLRLDAATIGRALVGTEGSVRALARSSGAVLDTPRATPSERLATAIGQTAVPDCLAPNPGGSLLSIPVIAYMALNGKCK